MTEYIESEKDKRIKNQRYEIQCLKNSLKKLRQRIKHLESKNKVVLGEWIPKNEDGSWRVDTCSACKKDTHYVRYAPAYDYCPNCGADMREAGG